MKKKMRLITLSGVDGSGKSTQAKLLKAYLESQGKKVYYFHAIEFGLAKKIVDFRNKYCLLCKLLGRCRVRSAPRSVIKANWLQIQLRKIFLKIDLWRFRILFKKLEGKKFDFMLSDRYFFDSIINLEYLMKKQLAGKYPDLKQPDTAYYLEISPEKIMQRERKPDQGIEYLEEKIRLFQNKKDLWHLIHVQADRSKEDIFSEIKEKTIIQEDRHDI